MLTEMPGPWRHTVEPPDTEPNLRFNLNRDARPLATLKIRQTWIYWGKVSISTEMPGPWRLGRRLARDALYGRFNLNRDARPLATELRHPHQQRYSQFQSQPRCQAPGDRAARSAWSQCPEFQSQPRCQAPGDAVVFFG